MKVVVTGATGMIGGALVRALVERGDEVTVLSRDARDARREKLGVEAVGWADPHSEPAPAEALARPRRRGAPARASRWPSAGRDDARREIRDSRVLGTRNLVAGAGALPEAERPAHARLPVGQRLVRRPRRRAAGRVRAGRRTTSSPR